MISKYKRNDIEIIAHMLRLAKEETKKTHLMYRTNLCYGQLVIYVDFLLEKGFLEKKNNGQGSLFCTTESGRDLLENIEKIMDQVR